MLDTNVITYLAKLSKLEVDEAEKEKLVSEMSAIVELMDTMNDVIMDENENLNSKGISVAELRVDKADHSYNRECVLQNAAHKKDGFFVVPKIME